ncbi:GH11493, putative [Babesia ovata]|uniref:GH11493, putative n=1 Tax=Babesia ovata TaxID=189622 RepID=A0A2H6KJ31_9APIC|nr:GH11493, putative [Babesia ovata]GBE63002.1 GH11493, putative [Babesia ovata]
MVTDTVFTLRRFIKWHDLFEVLINARRFLHRTFNLLLNPLNFVQNFIVLVAGGGRLMIIFRLFFRLSQIIVQRPSQADDAVQFLCDASVAAHLCTAAEKYRFQFVAHLPHCRGERAHYQFRGGFFATLSIFAFCALCVALADAIFNIGDEPSHVQRLFLYIVDCFSFSSIKLFIQRRGNFFAKPLDSLNTFSDTAADDINRFERLFGYTINIIAESRFHSNCESTDVTRHIMPMLPPEYPPHGAVVF